MHSNNTKQDESTVLSLDFTKPGLKVSPTLYGEMTEEINYSYDGGLYGELVRNRAFLDDFSKPVHWASVDKESTVSLEKDGPTPSRPMALHVRGAVTNDGYWGYPIRPSTTYALSLWAKVDGLNFKKSGSVEVSLVSTSGAQVFARTNVSGLNGNWRLFKADLKTSDSVLPTKDARLVLQTGRNQSVELAQVSLFPPTYHGRINGNRKDLMEKLVDLKPKFLRFPGGNYLEGITLADRFPWEKTLGPIENRPGHFSPWGYRSTDGMGLLEFLLWCEDMKAKPLLAVYAGYALNGQHINPGPDLQPVVQSALDEIEYVSGSPTSKWGSIRAKDGHPKPFPLEWVEVGNEDEFDRSGSYQARFAQIYDAIKAKYPKLKVISTIKGIDYSKTDMNSTKRRADLWDEHYYSEAWDMMAMATKYDSYSRTGPKVFVGEWASHDGLAPWDKGAVGPTPNLKCALGDAAFLTGLERNSDVVEASCYAPLLVNVNPGGTQWPLNLIGYDALNNYGPPSYYVQKLFSENLGTQTVPFSFTGVENQTDGTRTLPGIFVSCTKDAKSGEVYIKFVNALATSQNVEIDSKGASLNGTAMLSVLSNDDLKAINSLAKPNNVVPIVKRVTINGSSFHQLLLPQSVTVLRVSTRAAGSAKY